MSEEIPDDLVGDLCELCGRTRHWHSVTTHPFIPSARAQDAEITREPVGQGALASTRSAKPSDLLAELKAERAKHLPGQPWKSGEPQWCAASCCDSEWPCPLSRALDGMIAGVEMCEGLLYLSGETTSTAIRIEFARKITEAMARAYRGDDAK